MKRIPGYVLLFLGGLVGCAGLGFENGRNNPEAGLRVAAQLLEKNDFQAAWVKLNQILSTHRNDEIGQRALLMIAAGEMDPRNPNRRLHVGAQMAGEVLQGEKAPAWTEPLSETLYLLALELGAAEQKLVEAQEARSEAETKAKLAGRAARTLPRLPGQSVTARIGTLETERGRLSEQNKKMEARIAELEQLVAKKDQELERIRKTLRP